MSRADATKIDRQQPLKQMPVKIIQGTPTNSQIAGMNPQSIILDEANSVVYFKGSKFTVKVTGVRV